MTIDLSGLQIFNDAILNNRDLGGGARVQCESTQEGVLGRFRVKQIPSNRYVHEANNVARRNFADALTSAFGVRSLNDLPKEVRDVLKIEDFNLREGTVTSSRPLTMRRIRAVMTAIRDVRLRPRVRRRMQSANTSRTTCSVPNTWKRPSTASPLQKVANPFRWTSP